MTLLMYQYGILANFTFILASVEVNLQNVWYFISRKNSLCIYLFF